MRGAASPNPNAASPTRDQLTSIVWQDGSVRRYHHEDGRWPQAVTGITDEAGVRYGTYAYDAQGRVTRSELAGGAERLDFAYTTDAGGKPTTTVTDYSGAGRAATSPTYTFTDIGNVRHHSNLTAPCSLCGSTQQVSTYDSKGRLTGRAELDGHHQRHRRDQVHCHRDGKATCQAAVRIGYRLN
jgi:YD repeat-containing protein